MLGVDCCVLRIDRYCLLLCGLLFVVVVSVDCWCLLLVMLVFLVCWCSLVAVVRWSSLFVLSFVVGHCSFVVCRCVVLVAG